MQTPAHEKHGGILHQQEYHPPLSPPPRELTLAIDQARDPENILATDQAQGPVGVRAESLDQVAHGKFPTVVAVGGYQGTCCTRHPK